ncbi:MAG TPA: ABC transporter permease [Acidimicrobiia bacterium]|nr:ABC transporter permease [Acidimicrobiia bacterium]
MTTTTRSRRRRRRGLFRSSLRWQRTRIGLVLVLGLVTIALIGPLIAPYGPGDFVANPNSPPGPGYPFGTDRLGQDVLSRFLHGGIEILLLAGISSLLGVASGTAIGLTAAYVRGKVDEVLMRAMDLILAFPQILLALLVIAMAGPSFWLIVLTVAVTTMPRVARVIRGAAVPVVERDFVSAAEAIGESRTRVVLSELLPNVTGPLLVELNLRLTYSIGLIASLAFIGFAPNPNAPNWGLMVDENRLALTVSPWGVVLPVTAIALLTIGFGLVADGLARTAAGIERARDE